MVIHKSIAFLLLLAFFTSTFSRLFVVADYYVNTERYYKNCENKARPQLKCNGKCQMAKKVQEEEKKEQKNPGMKFDLKSEVCTIYTSTVLQPLPTIITEKKYSLIDIPSLKNGFDSRIFHPPIS